MSEKWYYTQSGQVHGPIPARELKRLAQSGELRPTDSVRRGDQGQWVRANKVRGLQWTAASSDAKPQPEPQRPVTPARTVSDSSKVHPRSASGGDPARPQGTLQSPVVITLKKASRDVKLMPSGQQALRTPAFLGLIQLAINSFATVYLREKLPTIQTEVTILGVIVCLLILISVIGMFLGKRWGALVLGILNALGAMAAVIEAITIVMTPITNNIVFILLLVRIMFLVAIARLCFEAYARAGARRGETSLDTSRIDSVQASGPAGAMTVEEFDAHFQRAAKRHLFGIKVLGFTVLTVFFAFLLFEDVILSNSVISFLVYVPIIGSFGLFFWTQWTTFKRYLPKCPKCDRIVNGLYRGKVLKHRKCPFCEAVIIS